MFTRENLAEMPEYHRRFGTIGFKFFPGIKAADAAVMTALPHTGPMLGIDDPSTACVAWRRFPAR
jgi:hypothetical protein